MPRSVWLGRGNMPGKRYGDWLEDEMRVVGLNRNQLVEKSGLSRETVAEILRGEVVHPTAKHTVALGQVFGRSPSEIFQALGLWKETVGSQENLTAMERQIVVDFRQQRRELQQCIYELVHTMNAKVGGHAVEEEWLREGQEIVTIIHELPASVQTEALERTRAFLHGFEDWGQELATTTSILETEAVPVSSES